MEIAFAVELTEQRNERAAKVSIAFAAGYMVGNSHGRQSVLQSLQSDRVTILKDGKKIDEKAIAADDTALCDLLGGCVVPDGQGH